jgi:hypothetical protein
MEGRYVQSFEDLTVEAMEDKYFKHPLAVRLRSPFRREDDAGSMRWQVPDGLDLARRHEL